MQTFAVSKRREEGEVGYIDKKYKMVNTITYVKEIIWRKSTTTKSYILVIYN